MECDRDILLESCSAFLRAMIGDDNWQRWQLLREQSQMENLHSFFTFLMDSAEHQLQGTSSSMVSDGYVEAVPQESVSYGDAEPYFTTASDTMGDFANQQQSYAVESKPVRKLHGEGNASTGNVKLELPRAAANMSAPDTGPPCMVYGDSSKSDTAFFCQVCNIHVTKMEGAMMHLSKVHQSSRIAIRCSYCGHTFMDERVFLGSHAPPNDCMWRLTCPYCHKKISSKYKLKIHISRHEGGQQPQDQGVASAGEGPAMDDSQMM